MYERAVKPRDPDPANWTPTDFESAIDLSQLEPPEVRLRAFALVDFWRAYVSRYGKKKLTPLAVANILFWHMLEWTVRGEELPHPGLTFDELKKAVLTKVNDNTVEHALRKVGRNIAELHDLREADLRAESHPRRTSDASNVTVHGPKAQDRGDTDQRLWLQPRPRLNQITGNESASNRAGMTKRASPGAAAAPAIAVATAAVSTILETAGDLELHAELLAREVV